jgi:hypothetical protein
VHVYSRLIRHNHKRARHGECVNSIQALTNDVNHALGTSPSPRWARLFEQVGAVEADPIGEDVITVVSGLSTARDLE